MKRVGRILVSAVAELEANMAAWFRVHPVLGVTIIVAEVLVISSIAIVTAVNP